MRIRVGCASMPLVIGAFLVKLPAGVVPGLEVGGIGHGGRSVEAEVVDGPRIVTAARATTPHEDQLVVAGCSHLERVVGKSPRGISAELAIGQLLPTCGDASGIRNTGEGRVTGSYVGGAKEYPHEIVVGFTRALPVELEEVLACGKREGAAGEGCAFIVRGVGGSVVIGNI